MKASFEVLIDHSNLAIRLLSQAHLIYLSNANQGSTLSRKSIILN